MEWFMLYRVMAILLVGIFFSGCLFSNEPGEDDIRPVLSSDDGLKAIFGSRLGMNVTDFEIKASENIGGESEPRFRTRLVMKVELTEPRFVVVKRDISFADNHVDVIRRVADKGEVFTAFVMTESFLRNEKWRTGIVERSLERNIPGEGRGKLELDAITDNGFGDMVEEGTADYKEMLARKAAWDKAEDARREREKKDLEIARMKREEQEAARKVKEQAEAKVREAKQQAEMVKRIKAVDGLLKKLNGEWEGVSVAGSPASLTVQGKKIIITYPVGDPCKGRLWLDVNQSSGSKLVGKYVKISGKPNSCGGLSNAKNIITSTSASSLLIERPKKGYSNITLVRQ